MLTQRKGRGFSSRNQQRKFTCQSPQSWPSWIIPSANSIKEFKLDSLTHFRGVRSCGSGERHSALIKGYSQMTKESNSMTGSVFKRYCVCFLPHNQSLLCFQSALLTRLSGAPKTTPRLRRNSPPQCLGMLSDQLTILSRWLLTGQNSVN